MALQCDSLLSAMARIMYIQVVTKFFFRTLTRRRSPTCLPSNLGEVEITTRSGLDVSQKLRRPCRRAAADPKRADAAGRLRSIVEKS